jgi:hypothetical protein
MNRQKNHTNLHTHIPAAMRRAINQRAHAASVVYGLALRDRWLTECNAVLNNGAKTEDLQQYIAKLGIEAKK